MGTRNRKGTQYLITEDALGSERLLKVEGQEYVKRVLQRMAAEGHNGLMTGTPGRHHLPGCCHPFSGGAQLQAVTRIIVNCQPMPRS